MNKWNRIQEHPILEFGVMTKEDEIGRAHV